MARLSGVSDPRLLLLTVLMTIIFMQQYYSSRPSSIYKELEETYFNSFWPTTLEETYPQDEMLVTASIPRHLSTLTDSEILLTIENTSSTMVVTPTIIIANTTIRGTGSNKVPLLMHFGDMGDEIIFEGSSVLRFEPIPPKAVVNKVIWVRVSPTYHQKQDNTSPTLTTVPFYFYKFEGHGKNPSNLYSDSGIAEINDTLAITRAFIGTILLPPWSNGALISLAFIGARVTIWVFDMGARKNSK